MSLTLYYTVSTFNNPEKESFSPFPTMFFNLTQTHFNFSITFILSSANAFFLDQSENLLFGKELSKAAHFKTECVCETPCLRKS